MELIKRTHFFIQKPAQFEVSGCDCGNNHTEWSEYEKHCWCSICQKDFIPQSNGVFDGPIMLGVAGLMGLSFDRYNLETNMIEVPNDFLIYQPCYDILKILHTNTFSLTLINKLNVIKADFNYKDNFLYNIQNEELITQHDSLLLTSCVYFNYPYKDKIPLLFIKKEDQWVCSAEHFEKLEKFLLPYQLEDSLKNNGKSATVKI